MNINEMTINDYDDVIALWQKSEGVGLHDDVDSKEGIFKYLQRNIGLSFVAREDGKVVGAVLSGYDGRRGYLHHLTVAEKHRGKGLGKKLAKQALSKLRLIGISKCHVFVFADNTPAQSFWQHLGWTERKDLKILSKSIQHLETIGEKP